jgi:hypothetical protein
MWLRQRVASSAISLSEGGRVGFLGLGLLAWAVVLLSGCSGSSSSSTTKGGAPDAASLEVAKRAPAAAYRSLWEQVKDAGRPCNDAARKVGSAFSSGDAATVSGLAQEAEGLCKTSMLAVNNMKLPDDLDGDKRAQAALETCQLAGYKKKHAMSDLIAALDSGRPSDVARMRNTADEAKAYDTQCIAEMKALVAADGPEAQS